MKKILLVSGLVCIIGFSSCEKDESTKPVKVNFDFAMEPYYLVDTTAKGEGALTIDQGTLFINTIEFDGRREDAQDYYFTSPFETTLQVDMHTGYASQQVTFDVPQGVYDKIELVFSLGNEENQAILVKGIFQQSIEEGIPVWFEYNFQDQVRVKAKNEDDEDQIVLTKSGPETVTVMLDASFLFRLVNLGRILKAERVQIEGEDVILINNEVNTDLFSLLVSRLDISFRVTFE